LDDLATRAAQEYGRADDRIPEHALRGGRGSGARCHRMDSWATKTLRTGDSRRRYVSCSSGRVLACSGIPTSQKDESASREVNLRRRLVSFVKAFSVFPFPG